MILSTLCYLENNKDQYLMLHRVLKPNDANHDKWIGLGGKFEAGESPHACALREVQEESGLTMLDARFRGIVTFVSDQWETEYMHLFTATRTVGFMSRACTEGRLEWVDKDRIEHLPIWQGDKVFLRLLAEEAPFFSLKLEYEGETLVAVEKDGKPIYDFGN